MQSFRRSEGSSRLEESQPRILPITDPTPEVAEVLATTIIGESGPLNVFATMAHHPRLLKRFNVLGGLFLTRSLIPVRDREVVTLRSAWLADCVYEFCQHTLMGRRAGLTDVEIRALAGGDHDWNSRDATLIAVADQIHSAAALDDLTLMSVRL